MTLARDPNGNPKELQVGPNGGLLVNGSQAIIVPVQIALNASLTGAIDLGTGRLAAIISPAAFDGAFYSFQASHDGAAWADLYDRDGEYAIPAAMSRATLVPLADFLGLRWLKIRSGKTGAPVVQAALRTLNLVVVS